MMLTPPRRRSRHVGLVALTCFVVGCRARSEPPAIAAPASSSSAPERPSCRARRALGLRFLGAGAGSALGELRELQRRVAPEAECTATAGELVIVFEGEDEAKLQLIQRARALGLDFAVEDRVEVGTDCRVRWAPASAPTE